ncbi:MAG TPA: hypothetical protein PKW35_05890 [Nannocystaceae bacterium]|nr:hypothetical protein [Nannocystaceae bacterium]
MNATRRPFIALATAALCGSALVGALVGFAPAARADGDACTTTKFQVAQVEKACKEGGRVAAKKLMNDAMKKAKAAGEQVNCKSCHDDVKDTFTLKANAVADLKKWL